MIRAFAAALVASLIAAIALGYMGPAALPAKDRVVAAIANATTENEKLLLQWCLREIASAPNLATADPSP